MSQEDLAHKVRGFSGGRVKTGQASVSDHERGINTPTGETVVLYALATRQPLGYFYSWDEEETVAA